MTRDSERQTTSASRRKFLVASGAAGVAALAGCSGNSGTSGNGSSTDAGSGEQAASGETETQSESAGSTQPLTADGSSTVFPITNTGASYWNSNPEPGDEDYWPKKWASETYDTDKRLADYFAGLYGYEATGERSNPPYLVNVALSHSGTGIEGVMDGRVDIGDASASAEAELSGKDVSQSELDKFVDHVVGVDGQPIVASKEIVDAGVEQITLDQLKQIYKGELTNWSAVGGPDKEILALGRAEGSGTDTAFRSNVYGDPEASISPDQRYGKNQQLQQAVSQADNAIAYIALAFVQPDGQVPPIGLEIDGTLYTYGKNLGSKEYPLSRDLHAYTWEDTSKQEAAFLNFVLSDFGQKNFVEANNYFKLPEERLKKQREKVKPGNYN
ncbi:phosphate ABC transporter substrate-binding protein, PhoT family [Halogranum amylolyticum]|uniref:Phosphate ABC transporter substrate-binding protein, PhoT family n=1 Tax=Halogranum amylolyticum TaxID=660520 RepID=A0A1H8W204_9EURY|nr:substrate-binding domain-containing protein [Halogranum amylolyticum]SEP21669.1 phosphate ABC transporter substrate-binding protein, PhoT family [Halogranum amylolyticum]